jgi:hypothetical protein
MPYAATNISVNGRWYDVGADLSDCSDEELEDLTSKDAVSKNPLPEPEVASGEDASTEADEGSPSGDDAKAAKADAKEGKGN